MHLHSTPPTTERPEAARRWKVRLSALLGAFGLAASFLVVPASTPALATGPLREHAAARNKFIGAALATGPLAGEAQYRTIAGGEFNQITAENAMKWDATESSDDNFNFSGADQIVNFATQNGQQVHGHTLVWHSQTPGYVQGLSATAMRAEMQEHINAVAGRYANNAAVVSWDVVNEAFNEDGTRRQSFWQNTMGNGYIADAFNFARAADPNARLCINDFNVEGINAKSTAMFNLVQQLRTQGVPIDCVGFQGHLAIQFGFPNDIQQNLQRFANLGVQVRITELDIRMQLPRNATKDATQATQYRNVVTACNNVTACAGVTIWGFTDRHSWVPDTFQGEGAALIYDENYNQKPAYTAVHDALAGPPTGGDTTPPTTPGAPAASGVTANSATLTWGASTDQGGSGLAGYNIYREQGATDPLLTQTTGTATTTNLTGLTASTQYQVYVRARDGAGNLSGNSTTTTFTTQSGGNPGGSCAVTTSAPNPWATGYVMNVTVTNNSTTTSNGWSAPYTLPAGHTIVNAWGATMTGGTATNASYNGRLTPGQSTTWGFQANRPNGNTQLATITTCTLT
jgi:endo-1,4-beta-xylanase